MYEILQFYDNQQYRNYIFIKTLKNNMLISFIIVILQEIFIFLTQETGGKDDSLSS